MHKKARRRKLTIATNKITMISRKYDEVHINKSEPRRDGRDYL